MNKPSMFIGSSLEGLEVARAIQFQLSGDAEVILWNEGPFRIGNSYIESLTEALNTFQFATLVFRADDLLVSRDITSSSVRGNLLFELGLFMGKLGRSRTFVVYDKNNAPSVISDLAGVSFAPYEERPYIDLRTAVGPACYIIREAVRRVEVEIFQNKLTVPCNHPAMLSYCQYIDGIYKKHFKNIYINTSLATIITQATKVYGDIFKTNCDVGLCNSENQFDHTLVFYIACWIRENIENRSITSLSSSELADRITKQIFSYLQKK